MDLSVGEGSVAIISDFRKVTIQGIKRKVLVGS